MKRLIALFVPLLAGSSLSSAQESFTATSGSMLLTPDEAIAPFTVAGPDFSAPGGMPLLPANPLTSPFHTGNNGVFFVEADSNDDFPLQSFGVDVHGIEWILPGDGSGFASASFSDNRNLVLSGPGTYVSTFSYSGEFEGVLGTNPGGSCFAVGMCTQFSFSGGGTVRYDVVPFPSLPGSLEISKATFTFGTPEPSTASLLLIGFAGFVVFSCVSRRRIGLR